MRWFAVCMFRVGLGTAVHMQDSLCLYISSLSPLSVLVLFFLLFFPGCKTDLLVLRSVLWRGKRLGQALRDSLADPTLHCGAHGDSVFRLGPTTGWVLSSRPSGPMGLFRIKTTPSDES